MKFNDKNILITGGTRGLGLATARLFLNEGARVAITGQSIDSTKKAESILAGGESLLSLTSDVSQEKDVIKFVGDTIEKFGRIDVLVNNAGVAHGGSIESISKADWDRVFAVNMTGVFLATREVVKSMIKNKIQGRIINIASVIGQVGGPMASAYAASKAGVINLTKSLAKELAPRRINVNCISPGAMDTDMYNNDTIGMIARAHQKEPEEIKKAVAKSIPLGRILDPDEVARLILFLAGEEGSGVTGRIWEIACGYEIH